ncbi:MAG: class I SAM-dependent methyltransferase, partial [Propionicimonas sp.]|nr:class I SAM-dependent methyltransferase [Propionicimonas sp.]
MAEDYLAVNRANWDARVAPHLAAGYGIDRLLADPGALSDVVRFDLPRLGDLTGLDVVHLQCHLGTDTLSLARLGGRVTGLDLSGASVAAARDLAGRAGAAIDYVQADVYGAVDALGGARFDLVYTGIGALCWLPSIRRWAETVAGCSAAST